MPPEHRDDPRARTRRDLAWMRIEDSYFRAALEGAFRHAADPLRADATVRPWVPMGPRNVGGRIRALAQDPENPSTLYAGSAFGGVWKTENAGDTWTPLDDFRDSAADPRLRRAVPVGAIGIAPHHTNILYVGTGEPVIEPPDGEGFFPGCGLYRSEDGGSTFILIDAVDTGAIRSTRYERILVDPHEPGRCWIACPKGLWRREPAGAFIQDHPGDASDAVIDFGPAGATPPDTYTVYAAVRGDGIYRAVFHRDSQSYDPPWTQLSSGIGEVNFHRIKLALCAARPEFLYAVFGLADESASRVYRSSDGGDTWQATAARAGGSGANAWLDDGTQAWYDLVLEVHPERPEIVFTGSVDLFRSMNAGDSWDRVMVWYMYEFGDRAQHGDQHAFLFDRLDPRKIWVGNDGGLSASRDLGEHWRKRSHGILAPQFYDISVHPRYPFITGGGMQDNGVWIGFGGESWFRFMGGDGGAVGFDWNSAQRFLVACQDDVDRAEVRTSTDLPGPGAPIYLNELPDLPDLPPALAGGPPLRRRLRAHITEATGFNAAHGPLFTAITEHHPRVAGHALTGRIGAGYFTTDGLNFTVLATGALTPADAEVTALAYAPSHPDTHWWLGTSGGEVFSTTNGDAGWGPALNLPDAAGNSVTDIAVNPSSPDIVAVSVAVPDQPGRVYLTGDGGATWEEISGRSAPGGTPPGPAAAGSGELSPSPVTCLAFDPSTPGVALSQQTLYAGTLAGVYVIRNAIAPGPPGAPAWSPEWKTFNGQLPLVLVYDLAPVVVRDAAGNPERTALRCATLGRGAYECGLGVAPEVRLFLRDTPIDDGWAYQGDALLGDDPRLDPMPALAFDQGFDIRVDAPPYSFFEDRMDGVEYDEDLRHDLPIAGERNNIYVQVHNGGVGQADGVTVHLYYAEVPAPDGPPPLQEGFWDQLEGDPPAGGPWSRVAPALMVSGVGCGQPVVACFEWTPPPDIASRVALLACCSHPDDPLSGPALPLVVDPADPANVVQAERRVALRITDVTPFVPDVYVRDGVNDEGSPGAVAWGGRSADIVVVQREPDGGPDAAFADPCCLRTLDRVSGNDPNYIYVRVSNRKSAAINAEVELFRIPYATLTDPASWESIGTAEVVGIPAHGSKFAAAIEWPTEEHTAPDTAPPAFLLAAVVRLEGDLPPDYTATITDLRTFWDFFLHGPTANNAALRALPYGPSSD